MINRKELKAKAKELSWNNKWVLWMPLLIIIGATVVANLIPVLGWIISIAVSIFASTYTLYVLKFVRGENPTLNDMIDCFKEKWLKIFLASLLAGIFTFLWSLLLIIPGIIAAFAYTLVMYLVVDSDLDSMDAIKKSKEMMKGHKWEFFVLQLSFIGWDILCGLTLGILYIWVIPWQTTTNALFYEEIKKLNN